MYQLRHLVAPACVAMVTVSDMAPVVMECLEKDIVRREATDSNLIHGNLLFVYNVIGVLKR